MTHNLTYFKRGLCLLAVAISAQTLASADTIQGAITFTGRVALDTSNVNTATSVTAWLTPRIGAVDGDFATTINSGDAVSFFAPWSLETSSTITDFWQVGGFHFDLLASSVVFQNYGFLAVEGVGTIYGNGYTATTGTWSFTTQSPSASGLFSFSASGAAVPESGATIGLLGLGILLVSITLRRVNTGGSNVG